MFKLTSRPSESTLATRRARDPFADMRSLMNRFFDDFSPLSPFETTGERQHLAPRVELHETPEAIEVSAELPGIDEKDVELTLERDALYLRGEKRSQSSGEKGTCKYTERSYGSFERLIPLSCEVDREKVEATFKKGILNVRIPKSQAARSDVRKIQIRS